MLNEQEKAELCAAAAWILKSKPRIDFIDENEGERHSDFTSDPQMPPNLKLRSSISSVYFKNSETAPELLK